MPTPTVTVVIPTHNRAWLIGKTIRYVLDQTYEDFEVVVVDNGSSDDTRVAVTGIGDPRVRYFYQGDSGSPASPRNTGIWNAHGKYVAFLDDDDVWYPTKLEKVVDIFTKDPGVDVVCHSEYMRRFGKVTCVLHYGPAEEDMYRRLLFRGNCLSGSATTVKADVLKGAAGFREEREYFEIEDYDLWLRLARMGNRFAFIDEPLGEFIVHGTSGTYVGLYRRFPNLRRMLWEHFANYCPASVSDRFRFMLVLARTFRGQARTYLELWRQRLSMGATDSSSPNEEELDASTY